MIFVYSSKKKAGGLARKTPNQPKTRKFFAQPLVAGSFSIVTDSVNSILGRQMTS